LTKSSRFTNQSGSQTAPLACIRLALAAAQDCDSVNRIIRWVKSHRQRHRFAVSTIELEFLLPTIRPSSTNRSAK
jgi:hypothetical protein